MSIDIWPPISPAELEIKKAESLARQLAWVLDETREVMKELKHGLDDCYALLAPIDPGSTLVLSTQRAEKVKGTITRVGTRVVKGTVHLQLRMVPHLTLTINPKHPIHIPALESLNNHLSESLDLLTAALALSMPSTPSATKPPSPSQDKASAQSFDPDPRTISDHLRALAASLSEATSLLKGRQALSDPAPDPSWQTESAPPVHFSPPLPGHFSFHLSLQEASLVLHLRALEPVDAPVNIGLKLGLALGTFRRLEHDEMDTPYHFRYSTFTDGGSRHMHIGNRVVRKKSSLGVEERSSDKRERQEHDRSVSTHARGQHSRERSSAREPRKASQPSPPSSELRPGTSRTERSASRPRTAASSASGAERALAALQLGSLAHGDGQPQIGDGETDVYVREKVRVETADPSLLSLYAKLVALNNTLAQARQNLAAVMGETEDEPDLETVG